LGSIMDELTQNLVPGEQLLFSTEKVNIKPHLTQAQKLAGGRVTSKTSMSGARAIDINGAMALTDRRIFVMAMQGVFSKKPVLKFEAIYDSGYAKTLIEATKTKNEEITQRSQDMSVFSRAKFMKEQGYSGTLKILTAVEPQKSLLGGESFILQVFTLHLSELGQKGKNIARKLGKVFSWGTFDIDKLRFELRIKQPLSTMKMAAESVVAGSMSVLYEIVKRYAGKTNVIYGPLMDIMQAKAQEIAGLVKEFEASAA
jgi:hypothetical protein